MKEKFEKLKNYIEEQDYESFANQLNLFLKEDPSFDINFISITDIISSDGKIEKTIIWKETLLHFAIRRAQIDIVKLLLEKGADIKALSEKIEKTQNYNNAEWGGRPDSPKLYSTHETTIKLAGKNATLIGLLRTYDIEYHPQNYSQKTQDEIQKEYEHCLQKKNENNTINQNNIESELIKHESSQPNFKNSDLLVLQNENKQLKTKLAILEELPEVKKFEKDVTVIQACVRRKNSKRTYDQMRDDLITEVKKEMPSIAKKLAAEEKYEDLTFISEALSKKRFAIANQKIRSYINSDTNKENTKNSSLQPFLTK